VTDSLSHLYFSSFQAARRLARAPAREPEARLHGHGFQLTLSLPSTLLLHDVDQADEKTTTLPFHLSAERWHTQIAEWDHQSLNDFVAHPSDFRILQAFVETLDTSGSEMALSSMPNRGVRKDGQGNYFAWRSYRFESAHHLPNVPPGHKCGRLHGHGFQAVIHIPAAHSEQEWNSDYHQLDLAWAPLYAQLHHHYLNDILGLSNPTSEWLAVWIWDQLKEVLPALSWITVFETASCGGHYDGITHRIWKDFSIDSATEEAGMTFGHTWTLRLNLEGHLHPTFGWAMDFADVKREFDPLFRSLDHQPLKEVVGLESPDSAGLARWIRHHAHLVLPQLGRVDVLDGCGSGASLDWGAGGIQVLAP
jgi:6-pyruvoyltetrahydropterin/6-carboxytetrahydropterin synthase